MSKKILFLVNHDVVIYNFRLELIERLLGLGYRVLISSPYGPRIDDLISIGCQYYSIQIDRRGTNIMTEMKLFQQYRQLIKREKPDIVLTYTIKPNIYGGMACTSLKVPYITNITGLGSGVERGGLLSSILYNMYRFSLKNSQKIFFQNEANRQTFLKHGIGRNKDRLIPGSGVNIDHFAYSEYPLDNNGLIFTFVGRLMEDKGIGEFIRAADTIKDSNKDVIFRCVGFMDDADKLIFGGLSKTCENIGFVADVRPYIVESHAIVLPSYHEGMANVLLEAAAIGRPVIATNISGCKETFEDGVTGLGCQPHDADSLTDALMRFIQLPWQKKKEMGLAGRKKMEREFDRNIVVNAYIEEIEKIND